MGDVSREGLHNFLQYLTVLALLFGKGTSPLTIPRY